MSELKNMPFTAKDIVDMFARTPKGVNVGIYEWRKGSGRNSTHYCYHVTIGDLDFGDGGKYKTCYQFASEVQRIFKSIEQELKKKSIVFIRETSFIENGTDYVWNSVKHDEIECVSRIVMIEPCREFYELQKWLKSKAGYELNVTDLFYNRMCQKRSSISRSGYEYKCEQAYSIEKANQQLQRVWKSGYKATVEIIDRSDFDSGYDRDRYEYEQYGYEETVMKVTITTATGRHRGTILI